MAASLSFFQRPNVKLYGRSFRAQNILLSSFSHLKNESYCKFPVESKHKQHKSRHLSIASAIALDDQEVILRPVKGHGPSLWADISFSFDNQVEEKYAEAIEELKDEVRRMVMAKDSKPKDKLILIDTLERLGLAYHFEQEIEDQIQHIFKFHANDDNDLLITTALHFRLFRQHGYDAPSNVFEKFKDEDNKFKKELIGDTEGLMSLYEASYLMYHEEDILEEAMVFTTNHLKYSKFELDSYLQEKVARALKQPIHKGIAIINARHYISMYEKKETKNELLLKLARLHFMLLQNLYRKEINHLSKWWKDLNVTSKLPYMRDRVVECYFWGVGISFEYEYSLSRIAVAKCMLMATLVNDTYDDYATLEESQIFTEILERWDIEEIDQLPNYMKIAYKVVFDVYKEYEHELSKQGRSYAASHVIESMKIYARSLNQKAKWYMGQEMPTFEDHMGSNGVIASCCEWIVSSSLMAMGSASKQDFDWLRSEPKFLETIGILDRYMNYRSTYDREHEAGQLPSAVNCYMKENGMSKEETFDTLLECAKDKWKSINKQWTSINSTTPMKLVLNYARISHAMYNDGEDEFTSPGKKGLAQDMTALFIDPILT